MKETVSLPRGLPRRRVDEQPSPFRVDRNDCGQALAGKNSRFAPAPAAENEGDEACERNDNARETFSDWNGSHGGSGRGGPQLRSSFAKSSQKKAPRIGRVTARMIVDSEKMIGTCDWCDAVMVQL